MRRVIVTGGHEYADAATVYRVLDRVHAVDPISDLIHGAARGADAIADAWARTRGVNVIACPADWRRHRNHAMHDEHRPDLVVGFPGGSGTRHMLDIAWRAGTPRYVIHTRYIVRPGYVVSQTDGERHFVGAQQLIRLYGLLLPRMASPSEARMRDPPANWPILLPRFDGDYALPPALEDP